MNDTFNNISVTCLVLLAEEMNDNEYRVDNPETLAKLENMIKAPDWCKLLTKLLSHRKSKPLNGQKSNPCRDL